MANDQNTPQPVPQGATFGPAIATPAPQQAQPVPQGATFGPPIAQQTGGAAPTPQEPPHDAGYNIESGINDFEDNVTNAVAHPLDTLASTAKGIWNQLPPVALYNSTKQMLPVINSYEQARNSGSSVSDALAAADLTARQHDNNLKAVQKAVADFKTNPTRETMHGVLSATSAAASLLIPGGEAADAGEIAGADALAEGTPAVEGADAATTSATQAAPTVSTPTPAAEAPASSVLKDIASDASPEEAQEAASSPKVIQALRDFAGDKSTGSIRKSLDAPIAQTFTEAKGLFKQLDDATGKDFSGLFDKLDDATDRSRLAAPGSAEEVKAEADRAASLKAIDDARDSAVKAGVPDADELLTQAKGKFQQAQALSDLRKRVYNNQNAIKGNAVHGVSEFAKVNNIIDTVEAMDAPNKYGLSRIAQTPGGADAVSKLKQALYDAQSEGERAAARQNILNLGKRSVGADKVTKAGRMLTSVFQPK